MCAIPERLRGVITTRCYTNPRLPHESIGTRQGAHFPLTGLEPVGGYTKSVIVARESPYLLLSSHLKSITALYRYQVILLGDSGTQV